LSPVFISVPSQQSILMADFMNQKLINQAQKDILSFHNSHCFHETFRVKKRVQKLSVFFLCMSWCGIIHILKIKISFFVSIMENVSFPPVSPLSNPEGFFCHFPQQMRSLLIFSLSFYTYKKLCDDERWMHFLITESIFSASSFFCRCMETINWIKPEKLHLAAKCENNDDTSRKHFVSSWCLKYSFSNVIRIEHDQDMRRKWCKKIDESDTTENKIGDKDDCWK
jgi:hypothetical protein